MQSEHEQYLALLSAKDASRDHWLSVGFSSHTAEMLAYAKHGATEQMRNAALAYMRQWTNLREGDLI